MDPLVKVVEGRKNKKEPKDYVNYCGFHLNEKAMASARSKGVVIAERRCKMVKREGAQYCPQHDVVANPNLVVQSLDNPDPERVPCPYSACQYDTYNGFSVPSLSRPNLPVTFPAVTSGLWRCHTSPKTFI